MASSPKALQVLKTLDKADRMPPEDVFDLLTKGRKDQSGDFTKGCDLTKGQALVLTGFVFSSKAPQISNRLHLMACLEETIINKETGETAWDKFLVWYSNQPEPKNIGWILDDLIKYIKKQKETEGVVRISF